MQLFLVIFLFLTLCSTPILCWDSVAMEVFDAVEDVNQNFYELMGISPDATVSDVKRAYRTLSKQIHPDKSDAPDAEIKFRQLVSVYEVLKDSERRGHYDRVLVDGLPDWRSAIYYYRRARKMGMVEITAILTVVISLAQYLMAWGSYFDTWKTMDEALSRKYRTWAKQKKKAGESTVNPIEEALAQIPKPSIWNIVPIQLCRGLYYLVRHGPSLVREYREENRRREQERREQEQRDQEERLQLEKEEEEWRAKKAAPKRRKLVVAPDAPRSSMKNDVPYTPDYTYEEPAAAGYNTGMWTNEEFCDLTKLMSKFPGGTVDRWDLIAEHLNRAPHEVTKMAVKMKDKLAAGTWLQDQEETVQAKIKTKTRAAESDTTMSGDAHWSSVQQKALERAIKSYPKGTDQRWEKMAKQVPNKTAEDCINRFKFLAERIRKKKEEEDNAAKLATQRDEESGGEEQHKPSEELNKEGGDEKLSQESDR